MRPSAEHEQKSHGRLIDPYEFVLHGCSADRVALSCQNRDEIYPISGADRLHKSEQQLLQHRDQHAALGQAHLSDNEV